MTINHHDDMVTLHHGDALDVARTLGTGIAQTIVTSPPYFGLRDYGEDGQIGAEASLPEYVAALVDLFRELRRVLADDGTLWLNLGDSYAGAGGSSAPSARSSLRGNGHSGGGPKLHHATEQRRAAQKGMSSKNLLGVPWRVALALQDDGWILRSDVIWNKPNSMPEAVKDRPTKSHEHLFLLAKSPRYLYDSDAIAETASGTAMRPQLARARQLADKHGLTDQHIAAIRSAGATDAGKAQTTQAGTGRNTEDVTRLADEAKRVLGGYYREFLLSETRNARDVWTVPTVPFSGGHFAVYPPELIRPCVLACSRPGDVVLDPFSGSGTTGMVATQEGRRYVGIDLNAEYLDLSLRTRFRQPSLDIFGSGS